MKILITGVYGFVGSNLVAALSKENIIYGLDIISPVKKISHDKNSYHWHPRFCGVEYG